MRHRCVRPWAVFPAVVICALTVLVSSSAFAQGGDSASLSGLVTDSSGGVIPGADVTVKNNATGRLFTAVTNERGTFSIPAVVNGSYSVTVSLMGFKTVVLNNVTVNAGVPASVRVTLEVGGLQETVVVQGESASIIQTQSAAVSTTMNVTQISNLPLTSRSALDFVINMPGVNTPGGSRDSTVNGLPQSTINITIDGMSVQDNQLKTTDGFFARVSPRIDAVEEVTVSMAAQGSDATGQGSVQVKFTTRQGTNTFSGSSYYYLRHYALNANTWFNNRDNIAKPENKTHQPGTRVGGPIVVPGLFDGRNKAFFFVNYEEQRTPGALARNRTILHPAAQAGTYRYNVAGEVREVNLLALAAASGHVATIDPTVAKLLSDIRSATGTTGTISPLTEPSVERYTYQVTTSGLTRYPSTRLDVNLTDRHRLFGSVNITDLLSNPDTLNNSEPTFPGFPGSGFQDSYRYATQVSLRSTLGSNLVNEFRVGGTGGATKFSPNRTPESWSSGGVADSGGLQINLNAALGINNALPGGTNPTFQAREASTKVIDNTLNWIKGTHSLAMGVNFTQGDVWVQNRMHVPVVNFAVATGDPAASMFTPANFLGASDTNINQARALYAVLTGRVSAINGEIRLDEATDEYRYLGQSIQRAQLRDYGFFISDTWRWKPNLTVNAGLRYVLQTPFYPTNNSYSTATMADVCGVSGVNAETGCNLFQAGVLSGKTPQFSQFNKGDRAYKTDWNNFAPSLGFAWTPGAAPGFLGRFLGAEGDSVLRAGFSVGYNRPGMSDFTGGIDDNPGLQQSANRDHNLGNLGTPGTIFLRNRSQLGAPAFPLTRNYPLTDVVSGDIHIFDENLQVPYAMTWTAGWQRKLTRDTAFEVRYVGTRAVHEWTDFNFNEFNIVENGFLDEFRRAQANLQANIAAGRGNTFAFTGAPGTAALPTFLAFFNGQSAASAGNSAVYTGSNWTNSAFLTYLAIRNPNPFGFASASTATATPSLMGNATLRANAARAGLPANFFVANPNLLGGALVTGNGGTTRGGSLQLELRKRLAGGLQASGSYALSRAYQSSRFGFRTPYEYVRDSGAEGEVTHAWKANWVYELPFGQGRRFGSGAGPLLDRLIGGWAFDGIMRIQSGRLIDFGNVRLVGMTESEFRKDFKLRFDDAGKAVYMLPQDIIDNTVKAFTVSATSPTGYGALGAPTGRYLAPANGPDCIEVSQSNFNNLTTGYGACGGRSLIATGPRQVRFDLSAVKRVRLIGRANFEFRGEFLNAFNHPWFVPLSGLNTTNNANVYNNADSFRLTQLVGETTSRVVQLVTRLSW